MSDLRLPLRRARRANLVVATALLAGLAVLASLIAAPLSAQDGGDFPAPLFAPMYTPDQPPSLQFTGFYSVPQADASLGTTFVVVARSAFEPVEGYRISVALGRPDAEHDRATLRFEGGQVVGTMERGLGGAFAPTEPIDVELVGNTARLTVPAGVLAGGQAEGGYVWLDADDPAASASVVGSLFPLGQVLDESEPGVLTASDLVLLPDGTPAPLPASPTLVVDGDTIRLSYEAPLPTEVGGLPVQKVTDIIRVVGDFGDASRATHLITVNHGDRRVSLVDAPDPEALPVAVEATEGWELGSYPTTAGVEGAVLEFDLSAVLESFGVSSSPTATALGVARSIDLTDGSVVRPDGVLGTLDWLDAASEAAPAEQGGAVVAAGDDGGRDLPVPLLVAMAVVVMVATGVWLWVRHRGLPVVRADVGRFEDPSPRHRLTLARSHPPPPAAARVESSENEKAELDRITESIFGSEE